MKVQNCSVVAVIMMAIAFASMQDAVAQLELPFRRAKNSAKSMELPETAGPWLIMCYSFSGDDGPQQAARLAAELREEHKLEAYTYTHRFDLMPKIAGRQLPMQQYVRDRNGDEVIGADGKPILREKKFAPKDSQIVETAVLIGSFSSVDDERAQKMLTAVKGFAPNSLAGGDPDALANDDSLAGGTLRFYRESINRTLAESYGKEQANTLRNAFLLPNPLLPEEYFAARSIDKFVIDLNRKVRKYSLLDCPGKYSVRVATFRGKTVINSSKIKQQMDDLSWRDRNGQKVESELAMCANKANMLTKALRAEGVEAWEFHDREESYVCVGSFDWLKKVDASGTEIQNPEIRQTIAAYKGKVQFKQGQPVAIGVPVPKSLRSLRDNEAIAYDIQPLPVITPKAPTARRAKLFSKWR